MAKEKRSFRLDPSTNIQLKSTAQQQGTSESAIVREAINNYFQAQKKG